MMKAAMYDGKGTMQLSEIEKPTPEPGDVIVRVRAAGICGSDLLMNADKTEPDALPTGHEVAGDIVEVGEGVDPSRIGQRVAIETIGQGRACTVCWYFRAGQYLLCIDQGSGDSVGGQEGRAEESAGDT